MNHKNTFIKGRARQMLLGNYSNTILAILIAQIIPEIAIIPFNHFCSQRYIIPSQTYIYYIALILIALIQIVLIAGTFKLHLNIGRGKPAKVSQMFEILNQKPDRVIVGAIIIFIISMLPYIPLLIFCYSVYRGISSQFSELLIQYGSVFDVLGSTDFYLSDSQIITVSTLLILGVVVMALLWLLFGPVLIMYADDDSIGTVKAFQALFNLFKGKRLKLIGLGFSFIGWFLLIILSLGVAALWIVPYLEQSLTNFYLDCKNELLPAEAGTFYKEV